MIVHSSVASSATSPGVAARTLACIADVLGAMAGERAGLRSGPARNESWMQAFELLDVCTLLCYLVFSTIYYFLKANKNQANSYAGVCPRILSVFVWLVLENSFCRNVKKELTLGELFNL